MSDPLRDEGVYRARKRGWTVHARNEAPLDMVLATLDEPGEVMKTSGKSRVRRVGAWVIKENCGGALRDAMRLTAQRARARRAWIAARRLERGGVGVARPVAYLERGRLGVVWRNALVSEYLDGFRDVEQFLKALIQRGAGKDTLHIFLIGLADAVNALAANGAYHDDLSGKNIYTADGRRFRFIDLDAVELDRPYDEALRLRNHVQLYDSFSDLISDALLVPFIERMIPPGLDLRVWMPRVRKAQAERRKRIYDRWAREGK